MNISAIIQKLKTDDEREWFEIPATICLDEIRLEDLANAAKEENKMNQLGVMVDIAIMYLISQSGPKYQQLLKLRTKLSAEKDAVVKPFYCGEDPRITKLNEKRTPQIVKEWNLIGPLDINKFIQVHRQEYEDRQRKARNYSHCNQ